MQSKVSHMIALQNDAPERTVQLPVQCPHCSSTKIKKNGKRKSKQNRLCLECGRQFIDVYNPPRYTDEIKQECLKLYANGKGFRAVELATGVCRTTIIYWVRQLGCFANDQQK